MKFKQYCEDRDSQKDAISRLLNQLHYGKKLSPEQIVALPNDQLRDIIIQGGLLPTGSFDQRIVGMVKSMASGATPMQDPVMPRERPEPDEMSDYLTARQQWRTG
jgi:hypothetical protein